MIKTTQTSLRTIKQDDPKFMLQDGIVVSPRAGFEFHQNCPREYQMIILECLGKGWLKPVATVKDSELFWEIFSND